MKKTVNKSLKSWLPMLCIALVGFACSFVVASFAWFADNENSTATVIVSDEVNIELTGTGEHGAILGFSDFASNTMSSAAVPGDTLTDAISVTIPASTSKSVLRLKYHVTIMENSTTVKEVTTNEEEIFKALLEKSFSDQTIGDASNDWTTNIESEDKWLYYQTLVGESDPNDMVVPVSSSLVFPLDMGSEFENIRFKVGVEAEAMQAGNFDQINDWEHDVRLLDSTVLWQRIVNYNASRGVSLINNIQRFIPYIVSTGTQWIDTNFRVENENVAYSLLASISSTSLESCSMFGSETYGNASSVPVGHDNNRIFAGVPYGGYDGTRLQYSMFYGGGDNGSVDFEIGQKFNLEIESVNNGSADTVTVKKNGETQISSSVPSVVTHGSVFLFNNGKPDGASTNQQIAGMQVYCFRIFEDGELVRELYPALDNFSVPCMYDMVEDVIYYNAGSGSFAYLHNTITYHLNGGVNSPNNPEIFVSDQAVSLSDPTKTGYIFNGWFDNQLFEGTPVSGIALGTSSDIELWARWLPPIYCNVSVVSSGIEYGSVVGGGRILASTNASMSATPEHGKVFVGWKKDGVFVSYDSEYTFTLPSYSADMEFEGVFADGSEKLSFALNANGRSYSVSKIDITTTSGKILIPERYYGLPVTDIADNGFDGCTAITSVSIPTTVTIIGNMAFNNCYGLTAVVIPDSVTSIENYAFYGCSGLVSITVEATVPPTLGTGAIPSAVSEIYVPSGSVDAYKAASGWSDHAAKIQAI